LADGLKEGEYCQPLDLKEVLHNLLTFGIKGPNPDINPYPASVVAGTMILAHGIELQSTEVAMLSFL
jgi:hypothetical protein